MPWILTTFYFRFFDWCGAVCCIFSSSISSMILCGNMARREPLHVTYGGVSTLDVPNTLYVQRPRNTSNRKYFSHMAFGMLCLVAAAMFAHKLTQNGATTKGLADFASLSSRNESMFSLSNVKTEETALLDNLKDNWVGMAEALAVILAAEIFDKTFFVALILAMRYDKWAVFAGSTTALGIQAICSALFGALVSKIDHTILQWSTVIIYVIFGVLMVYDGYKMDEYTNRAEAQEELEKEGLIETEPADNKEAAKQEVDGNGAEGSATARKQLPLANDFWTIAGKSFMLMLVAEFGDRTQIAVIVLCSRHDPLFVCLGAIIGFMIVTAGAVLCGDLLSGRVSERSVTICGGIVFLVFALVSLLQVTGVIHSDL